MVWASHGQVRRGRGAKAVARRLLELEPWNQKNWAWLLLPWSMAVKVIHFPCWAKREEVRTREVIHEVIRVKNNQTGHMKSGKQWHRHSENSLKFPLKLVNKPESLCKHINTVPRCCQVHFVLWFLLFFSSLFNVIGNTSKRAHSMILVLKQWSRWYRKLMQPGNTDPHTA